MIVVDSDIHEGYLRRNMLSFEQAYSLQTRAESLLEGFEFEVPSRNIMELVRDSECSAYDCEFVALAERLNAKFVTMDKKVLKAFPKTRHFRCGPTFCQPAENLWTE